MVTHEGNIFQKTRKCETRIGKAWGVGPPWRKRHSVTKCHLALQKCRTALLKCQVACRSTIVHSCNFAFSSIFLGLLNTQKGFFWLNWGIRTCLTYLFSKFIICIIIFKNWPNQDFSKLMNTSQTRGIHSCLIHFQKKK